MDINDLGVLGHILNKSHDEIKSALLNEEGQLIENLEQKIKEIHEENLTAQTNARKEIFDNGYKKAQKEVLEKKESELRQKFEVSGGNLDDIVQEIYDSGKKEANINPSDVKNSEVYLTDVKKFQTRIQELETALEGEKKQREMDKIRSVAYDRIPAALKEAKKVLPEDADMREYVDLIMLQMERKGIRIALNDEGEPFPVNEEGNRIRNDRTLKDLTFQEVIESNAFFLPTAQNSGGESPGNANPAGGRSGKSFDYSHVKSSEDYIKAVDSIISDYSSPDQIPERDERMSALEAHGSALGL